MQRRTHLSLVGLLTLIAVSAMACARDSVGPPADLRFEVSEVRVSPPQATVAVGSTVQFTAAVLPSAGVIDRTVSWYSSDSTVARVDQTGLLTALRPGVATIIVQSNQNPFVKVAVPITSVGTSPSWPFTISAINIKSCTPSGECTSTPANLTSVAGQVDVVLYVGVDLRILKSVQATLNCGTKSVSAQRTDLSMIPESPPLVTLSINTLQVDSAGARMLPNGACLLSASATALTGVQSATSGTQFTLNNVP